MWREMFGERILSHMASNNASLHNLMFHNAMLHDMVFHNTSLHNLVFHNVPRVVSEVGSYLRYLIYYLFI